MQNNSASTSYRPAGFSLIELVVVLAIIAILALMAIPLLYGNTARAQIVESLPLAKVAQDKVQEYYNENKALPSNNAVAKLPEPEKLIGNYVSKVEVNNGVVNVTFGNKAHAKIAGLKLSFRIAVVPDSPPTPPIWICGNTSVPKGFEANGTNATNVPPDTLPIGPLPAVCR